MQQSSLSVVVISRHRLTPGQKRNLKQRGYGHIRYVNPPGRLRQCLDAILGVQTAYCGKLPDLVVAVLPRKMWAPFLEWAAASKVTVVRAEMEREKPRKWHWTGCWLQCWYSECEGVKQALWDAEAVR